MLLLFCVDPAVFAVEPVSVPEDLHPFVLPGYFVIAIQQGDLNRDQREDCILVLQKEGPESVEAERPLLILTKNADGAWSLAKRNDKLVYCENCGGVMGDPFQELRIENNSFTVSHYGGSARRWSVDYTFGYSRKDSTWQLTKVVKTNFHASSPEEVEESVLIPPRDYGKIDVADFDPENYAGQGPK